MGPGCLSFLALLLALLFNPLPSFPPIGYLLGMPFLCPLIPFRFCSKGLIEENVLLMSVSHILVILMFFISQLQCDN